MLRKMFMAMIAVLVLACGAGAEVQRFGHFTVNVPAGWKGELQGSTMVVKSERKNASLAVAFNETGGASLSDIVERLYVQMEGENLEQDEDGDYTFTFKNLAGADSVAIVTEDEGYYLVLSLSGFEDEEVMAELEAIMDSVDFEE